MSAYREAEPRGPFVVRVGVVRGWYFALAVAVPSAIHALINLRGFLVLTILAAAGLAVWLRQRTVTVDRVAGVLDVDGQRVPIADVIGVSARSQLELVISVRGSEDIVLVPAGLTDRNVARTARELREAIDELR